MIPESFWRAGAGKHGAWHWLHEGVTMLILVPDGAVALPIIVHADRLPDDWSKAGRCMRGMETWSNRH